MDMVLTQINANAFFCSRFSLQYTGIEYTNT